MSVINYFLLHVLLVAPHAIALKTVKEKRAPQKYTPWKPGDKESLTLMYETFKAKGTEVGMVVNVGAQDGKNHDPCYPAYLLGAKGVVFEGDNSVLPALRSNMQQFAGRVKVLETFAHVPTIAHDLKAAGVQTSGPDALDLLKVDIDSYDMPIINAILDAGYSPKLIQMEVNPDVPPPFQFSVLYDSNFVPDFGYGFYGVSLAEVANQLEPRGYSLYTLEFSAVVGEGNHDAIFIRDDVAEELGWATTDVCTAYFTQQQNFRCLYMCQPDVYPADLRFIMQHHPDKGSHEIAAHMYRIFAGISRKHKSFPHTPFTLGVLPLMSSCRPVKS